VGKSWFLESIAADGSPMTQPIFRLPFRVGRDPANDLAVPARGLSRHHAEIADDATGGLCVTDLGSTNGTFVNRDRISGSSRVGENDVIHFGNAEFRLGAENVTALTTAPADDDRTLITPSGRSLSTNFVRRERQFMELLRGEGLSAAAQPIVDARTGKLYAYELLGRCTHPDLPASPIQLFLLAASLDREAELSEAFRNFGVAAIAPRLKGARLFVNTHPKETFAEGFFDALKRLRALQGAPDLVVEIHESAVMEIERMRDLAQRLAEIGVSFAYDDFGAGQARLNEIGDVPAHFVKFDMGLIRGLHEATERKQRVVRDLVRLVLDLGSVPLAEGVELEAEAALCREMGFELVQGYLTGRPMPLQSV
jgi:EAL domain-containing protein (putative c-di-GMP-specific phosphodiesterase class I)